MTTEEGGLTLNDFKTCIFIIRSLMALNSREIEIEVKKKKYEACVTTFDSEQTPECGVILTHGAGGDMNTKQLLLFSENLANAGFLVLRFTCKGLNLVHRSNVYMQVLKYLKNSEFGLKNCLLAGRSMGSRAAVDLANRIQDDEDLNQFVCGVICISYPLYPPQDKHKLRDGPLKDLKKPVLFISGTQDEMCEKDMLIKAVSSVLNVDYYWVDGAAHSLEAKGLDIQETVKLSCGKIRAWYKIVDSPLPCDVELNFKKKRNKKSSQTTQSKRAK